MGQLMQGELGRAVRAKRPRRRRVPYGTTADNMPMGQYHIAKQQNGVYYFVPLPVDTTLKEVSA